MARSLWAGVVPLGEKPPRTRPSRKPSVELRQSFPRSGRWTRWRDRKPRTGTPDSVHRGGSPAQRPSISPGPARRRRQAFASGCGSVEDPVDRWSGGRRGSGRAARRGCTAVTAGRPSRTPSGTGPAAGPGTAAHTRPRLAASRHRGDCGFGRLAQPDVRSAGPPPAAAASSALGAHWGQAPQKVTAASSTR